MCTNHIHQQRWLFKSVTTPRYGTFTFAVYTVYSTPNASRVACALRKSFPSSLYFDKTAFHFPTHAQLWTSNHYSTRVSNTHGSFEVQTCAYISFFFQNSFVRGLSPICPRLTKSSIQCNTVLRHDMT